MELKRYRFFMGLSRFALLIVPYGIETKKDAFKRIHIEPFNRTLWN